MDISFNSLLKRIVELSLSITSGPPDSVQVLSLGDEDQLLESGTGSASSSSQDDEESDIRIAENDMDIDNLGGDLSLSDEDSEHDSEEDAPEMQLLVSQLLSEAEELASATEKGVAELHECLVKIEELFAQEERVNQELLASQLVEEGNLEEIYALSFNLFEG